MPCYLIARRQNGAAALRLLHLRGPAADLPLTPSGASGRVVRLGRRSKKATDLSGLMQRESMASTVFENT